jgi:hypothetical protein
VHEPIAPRHTTMDSVILYQPPPIPDGPPGKAFRRSISATNQSRDELDTLTDNGDELPSLMDILARAWSVAPRVASQTINLTPLMTQARHPSHPALLDANRVRLRALYPPSPPLDASPARVLPSLSMESPSLPAVHNIPVATPPPRKSLS